MKAWALARCACPRPTCTPWACGGPCPTPRPRYGNDALQGALVGVANLLSIVAPLYLMCAPRDINVVYQVKAPITDKPTLFLYDAYPGGVGLSEKAYRMQELLLEHALDIAQGCGCEIRLPQLRGPRVAGGRARQGGRHRHSEGAACLMADLLSKLRMLDAAPKRPAPAARGGAGRAATARRQRFPLSIFTDLRHLTRGVMESAFGFAFPSDLRPQDILFLDTETTGLAGGAGTVAFLVGLGYFTAGGFAVEQVLMRDYGQERRASAHGRGRSGRFPVLCTFNGRTFDAPLLASRFAINRIAASPPLPPRRRPLSRPQAVEAAAEKLHAGQSGERSFSTFPGRTTCPAPRCPRPISATCATAISRPLSASSPHNRQDIVSLAQLLCFLCAQVDRPETRRKRRGPALPRPRAGKAGRNGQGDQMLPPVRQGRDARSRRFMRWPWSGGARATLPPPFASMKPCCAGGTIPSPPARPWPSSTSTACAIPPGR